MRLFLDANVLVSSVTVRNLYARRILDSSHGLFSNEYAVKEMRRALALRYHYPAGYVNEAVDEVRRRVRILATPPKNNVARMILGDASDAPIVCGAKQLDAVLVTEDHKTYLDARKYVKTLLPEEVK